MQGRREKGAGRVEHERKRRRRLPHECGTRAQWGLREKRSRAESESGELIVARAADEAAAIRGPDLWAPPYISPRGHTRACACVGSPRLALPLPLPLFRSFLLRRSATEVATMRCDRAEMSWWWWWWWCWRLTMETNPEKERRVQGREIEPQTVRTERKGDRNEERKRE